MGRFRAAVELDLDALAVAGEHHVAHVAEMPVEADDVDVELLEGGEVGGGGAQALEDLLVRVDGDREAELVGLLHEVAELGDGALGVLLHREQAGEDAAEAIRRRELHVGVVLVGGVSALG